MSNTISIILIVLHCTLDLSMRTTASCSNLARARAQESVGSLRAGTSSVRYFCATSRVSLSVEKHIIMESYPTTAPEVNTESCIPTKALSNV